METVVSGIHTCAEIQYASKFGLVHSDICATMQEDGSFTEKARAFLHANLDEWLDKSGGTGFFYIGNVQDAVEQNGT